MKKPSITLIKILLSAGMLALVVSSTRTDKLVETLSVLSIWAALGVTLGYVLGQVFSTVKWWIILREGGLPVPYPKVLRAYFVGMFVNVFGLGTVGGDVTRGLLVAAGSGKKLEGISSVFADRLHGLSVLAFIGLGAAALWGGTHGFTPVLLGCALAIPTGWWLAPRLAPRVLPEGRFKEKILAALAMLPQRAAPLATITAISAVFHCSQLALHVYMASIFSAVIPLSKIFTSVPFVNMASTLPISWNGLGVREQAYKFFLVPDVLTAEQAVGFGALWLVAVTASSAIGGVVAVLTGGLPSKNLERQAAVDPVER